MILAELYGLYERLSEADSEIVPARGWSIVNVSWELCIDAQGGLLSIVPLTSGVGKSEKDYAMLRVPQHDTRTSGIKPFFLCDSSEFLLGLGEDRAAARHRASLDLHEKVLAGIADSPACSAVLSFLKSGGSSLESQQVQELGNGGFAVIRFQGDNCYIHERMEVVEAWEDYLNNSDDSPIGQCAVTGEHDHLARLFPLVRGIPGAQSSGASLVSFNKPSFESYGASQTYNASVSERVAFESGEALRYLFRDQKHHVNYGNTHVVFWADRPSPAEDLLLFNMLGGNTEAEDEDTVELIGSAFDNMKRGRPLVSFRPETNYCILGMSPNAARLSVRFFYSGTLGDIASNYGRYLRDVALEGQEKHSLPLLLRQTAVLGKRENVPSTVLAPCFDAMLTGKRFPASLMGMLLSRMRADHAANNTCDMGRRASLMKACLLRNWRYGKLAEDRKGDLTVALNRENDNIGYLLGRLFAVMECAQSAGVGETNATIRDRYIGAAAATPARVFPQLFHGLQNSLTAVRKRKAGLAFVLERELDEIAGSKLPGDAPMPTTLDMEDQGQFYIGYYQERVDLCKHRKRDDGFDDDVQDAE